MRKILIFLMFFLVPLANADTTGTINTTSTVNATAIVTGMWGASYGYYCNSNSSCQPGDDCSLDYDGNSANFTGTVYAGWCITAGDPSCRHDNTYTATGGKVCGSTSKAWTCTSGVWNSTTCNSTQSCIAGVCTANAASDDTGTSTSGSSSTETTTTTTTTLPAVMDITPPSQFEIVQGNSTTKDIKVKNIGDADLSNVSVTLDIDWYTITPDKVDLAVNEEKTFNVSFTVPEKADVKDHSILITATSDEKTATKGFIIRVLPSAETVQEEIIPKYDEYLVLIQTLEANITELESQGVDVQNLRDSLEVIKDKLVQANNALDNQDYFAANVVLDEAKTLMDELSVTIETTEPPEFNILLVIVPVLIGIAAVLGYLFWPTKEKSVAFPKLQPKK